MIVFIIKKVSKYCLTVPIRITEAIFWEVGRSYLHNFSLFQDILKHPKSCILLWCQNWAKHRQPLPLFLLGKHSNPFFYVKSTSFLFLSILHCWTRWFHLHRLNARYCLCSLNEHVCDWCMIRRWIDGIHLTFLWGSFQVD